MKNIFSSHDFNSALLPGGASIAICELATDDYITGFHNPEKYIKACSGCPDFAKTWSCPPFDYNPLDLIRKYQKVCIVGIKIPVDDNTPASNAQKIMLPAKQLIGRVLMKMEALHNGRASTFIGKCVLCDEMSCTRPQGLPCRHPNLLRPSLEAYGFNVSDTASGLLGIDILWSKNGILPPYLTLIAALFHNSNYNVTEELSSSLDQ